MIKMIDYEKAFNKALETLDYMCADCERNLVNCPLDYKCCFKKDTREDWKNYILKELEK